MKQNKTQRTDNSVSLFLDQIEPEQKRKDSHALVALMSQITAEKPKLWGTSIIGFGDYHYKYRSGREGDWFLTGFSPRKNALTVYLMCDLSHEGLDFDGLGKYKLSKGCLYFKKIEDVDLNVLTQIIKDSIEIIKKMYS
jgi:nucleoid DNA-binding protein